MIGSRLRSARLGVVAALVATSVLSGLVMRPAAANNSGLSLMTTNSFLISDLAAQGYGAIQTVNQSGQTVSASEQMMVATATNGVHTVTGLQAKPKAGGKLGMVLNTVGVLGGLAFAFGGGEDEPELPVVPAGETATGNTTCGWTTVVGASFPVNCIGTNVAVTMPEDPPTGIAWQVHYDAAGGDLWAHCGSGSQTCSLSRDGRHIDRVVLAAMSGCNIACLNGLGSRGEIWLAGPSTTTRPNPAPGGVVSDPAQVPRYIDSTITCKSAGGGSQVFTRRDGPFTITPGAPWETPEVPDMTCPEGTWLASGNRTMQTPSAPAGQQETQIQDPYVAPDWVEQQVIRFPNCYPATTTMCVLKVERIAPAPTVDCHAYSMGSANPCAGWWTDPKRSTNYQCTYGGEVVGMKRCAPYAETFTTGTVAPTDPNPDEEITDPTPGTDPTPEATPNLGDCVPNWSLELLNPWWVFKAQACALMWAFVPQTSLQTRVSAVKQSLELRVPFVWFDGFLTIPGAVPAGGCPDWRVKIPTPDGGTALDKNVVCDSSYTDAIRTARPVLLVFMASVAFWPMIRSIGYASFPIIKPVPGGGR